MYIHICIQTYYYIILYYILYIILYHIVHYNISTHIALSHHDIS